MWLKNLFKSLTSIPSRQPSTPRRPQTTHLCMETLEDRWVPSNSVIDLGTLGGTSSYAADINTSGQIVGSSTLVNETQHAFLWQNGLMTDLGTLGGSYSKAFAINDLGQIVGESNANNGGPTRAFLLTPEDTDNNGSPDRWFRDSNADGKNDLMRDLGTLGGSSSSARDISNSGIVVGDSLISTGYTHAFRWQNGSLMDLGTLNGGNSYAKAINEVGQIIGTSEKFSGSSAAFLWQNNTMNDIGNFVANSINESGRVSGYQSFGFVSRAILWTPSIPNGTTGSLAFLGELPGDYYSSANALNDSGSAIGESLTEYFDEYIGYYYTSRPVLWSGGSIQGLNDLLPLGSNGWLEKATSVNNAGQIVGNGYFFNAITGQSPNHAFLLTPINLALPFVSIEDTTVIEGNVGTRMATFTVRLSQASNQTITINYTTVNGSATSSTDYLATSGVLTFSPGQLTKTISVPIIGDREAEYYDMFYVALTNPTNAILADATAICNIENDEPHILANGVTVVEGNSGSVSATFTVELSNAYDQTITVQYATVDGSATSGVDYLPVSGQLTFAPGQTSKQVTVSILGDRLVELLSQWTEDGYEYFVDTPEYFFLDLFNATGTPGILSDGMMLIQDNEPRIRFNPASLVVTEGNNGQTNIVATVSLSNAYDQTVTVNYTTVDGSAIAGNDYLPKSGSLTFAPGETSKTIPLTVIGDRLGEFNETFYLNLSNASNNAYISGQGSVVIADDEPYVTLEPGYFTSVTEGNSGTTPLVFTVRLSALYDQTVTVSYSTINGDAVAGNDFVGASGSVTFAPGETTKTFTVQVIGDSVYEYDEYFQVALTSGDNTLIGVGTTDIIILNDDPVVPVVSTSGCWDNEGNSGTKTYTFIVTLSEATNQLVTVNYSTANGTAVAGSDYQSASGTITFAPGETYKSISVLVKGDRLPEADETFFLNLSNATNAVVIEGQNSGVGTIVDDEPRMSISDVLKKEGKKNQTTQFTFTVTLSAAYDQQVTMSFRTVDGTAKISDNDYLSKTGTITFQPGETSKTITIDVKGDIKKEANETFFVDLYGNSSNSLISKSRGIGTILNDDSTSSLSTMTAPITVGGNKQNKLVNELVYLDLYGIEVDSRFTTKRSLFSNLNSNY